MIRILPRYLLRETLIPTALSFVTLTFILLIQVLFTHSDEFAGAFSFGLLVELASYFVPSLWILVLPVSVLIGVLLGVGRMTVDNEIKAMRTHGVNMLGIFLPTLVVGALLALASLYNNLCFAPAMQAKFYSVIDSIQSELLHSLEPGRFEDRFHTKDTSFTMYFDKKNQETGEMQDVYLSIEGAPKGVTNNPLTGQKKDKATGAVTQKKDDDTSATAPMRTLVLASTGRMITEETTSDTVSGKKSNNDIVKLVLHNGTIHATRGREDPRYTVAKFETLTQLLDTKSDRKPDDMVEAMTLKQLRVAMHKAKADMATMSDEDKAALKKKRRNPAGSIQAELDKRISFSLATFCFVLIGLPLAIYVKPSGKASGIGIAFGLIMAYYGFMHYGVVLTRQTVVGHSLTFGIFMTFLPNIILAFLGLFMMRATIRR
ncbi:TPA: hypothetical protein DDW35_03060 [Candidatus Sumerlaeota bacterium]|nr:hypothetical protein [Candidatus Sumerlaeota bacterium]